LCVIYYKTWKITKNERARYTVFLVVEEGEENNKERGGCMTWEMSCGRLELNGGEKRQWIQ
jgi:hypothetical protein